MAKRSFKTQDPSDIPPLRYGRDLTRRHAWAPAARPWTANAASPPLTRNCLSVSADGRVLAWVEAGKLVKVLHLRGRRRPIWEEEEEEGEGDAGSNPGLAEDDVITITCKKVICSISLGKLESHSIRKCARPINASFHRVLNFPSENGYIVAAGYERGEIDLLEVETRSRVISLVDHKDDVRDVKFAPNGSLLLLSSSRDESIKIWDCQDDGNLLRTFKPLKTLPRAAPTLSWSPDASEFAAACGNVVHAWDVADISVLNRACPVIRQFRGHQNVVTALAYSQDGTLLLTGGNDCLVMLWNVSSFAPSSGDVSAATPSPSPVPSPSPPSPSLLRVFRTVYPCASRFEMSLIGGGLEAYAVEDVAFSPCGNHVTCVSGDGVLRVWRLFPHDGDDGDDPVAAVLLRRPIASVVVPGVDDAATPAIAVGLKDGSVKVFRHPPRGLLSLQDLARNALRKHHKRVSSASLPMPKAILASLSLEHFKAGLYSCDCESKEHHRSPQVAFERSISPGH